MDWLKACIEASATMPVLRETFVQYERLIKKLTGDTMDEKQKNETLGLLKKDQKWDEEKITAFLSMLNAKNEIGKALEQSLWGNLKVRLQEDLKDENIELELGDMEHWKRSKLPNFWSDNFFKFSNKLNLFVGVEKGCRIYYGFLERNNEQFKEKGIKELDKLGKYGTSAGWLIKGGPIEKYLIHFDEVLYKKAAQKVLFDEISNLVKKVVDKFNGKKSSE